MAKPVSVAIKQDLLTKCLEHCIKSGFTSASLREIAEAVGTSHRMLIYHFETRENLLRLIVERFREEQIVRLSESFRRVRSAGDLERALLSAWTHISSPAMRTFMTTSFEMYVDALRPPRSRDAEAFLVNSVPEWSGPIRVALNELGHSEGEARTLAHLIVAGLRGFLLVHLGAPSADNEKAVRLFLQRTLRA